uniref:Uncharacterized protein n=1 Tax=Steinernema glaseri TaxID=37863 RepID=A0A1I8AC14_9BILA
MINFFVSIRSISEMEPLHSNSEFRGSYQKGHGTNQLLFAEVRQRRSEVYFNHSPRDSSLPLLSSGSFAILRFFVPALANWEGVL